MTTTDARAVGLPVTPFSVGTLSLDQMFSVANDGQRFLVNARPQNSASVSPVTVIVNWPSTVQK